MAKVRKVLFPSQSFRLQKQQYTKDLIRTSLPRIRLKHRVDAGPFDIHPDESGHRLPLKNGGACVSPRPLSLDSDVAESSGAKYRCRPFPPWFWTDVSDSAPERNVGTGSGTCRGIPFPNSTLSKSVLLNSLRDLAEI
ncbi:hypothetical protein J6590_042480 [Homalodisca vitripennis]|nr:hypothetical protein J6590_042480 [Homalodisca vitripennis]